MKARILVGALVAAVALVSSPGTSLAAGNSQQFLLNTPEGSTTTTVTATGVFNGVGEDVVLDDTFVEGQDGNFSFTSKDSFVFDQGNLFVNIAGTGNFQFDEENCAGSGSGTASYKIAGGTSLFDGAKGKGTATFDFAFVGEKDPHGGCVENEASGVFFAKLTGNLKLSGSVHVHP